MRIAMLALLAALTGCSGSRPAPAAAPADATCPDGFGDAASLLIDRAPLKSRPDGQRLLRKLDASAYNYFRALGTRYALRTCASFRDVRWRLASGAIHGDPHVEQFAVTPASAGLEDFDQAGFGPAVIDIVRYASSIHLACGQVSWPCRADVVVDRWLDAYRNALDRPAPHSTPAVVKRLRSLTPTASSEWLAWAEGLMVPLPAMDEQRARAGWHELRDVLQEWNPKRDRTYFDLVRVGGLQMGIGSALATKLLLRLRGATDDPADDVILEARTATVTHLPECSANPSYPSTMWPLLFMSTLGTRMPELFGVGVFADDASRDFWVQSWEPGYRELTVSDLRSEAEFVELVEDAALQLAGHFWTKMPEALRATHRHTQLRAFDLTRQRARELARTLADETVHEWHRFRGSAP